MVGIGFLRQDVPFGLLVIILICVSIIAGAALFYLHNLEAIQAQHEASLSKLVALEQQLILKEQELESLRNSEQRMIDDRERIHSNLLNLETRYQTLRIEKLEPVTFEQPRPFSKAICKASGNADC